MYIENSLNTFNTEIQSSKNKHNNTDSGQTAKHVDADSYQFSAKAMDLLKRRELTAEEQQQFGNILSRAKQAGAHDNPFAFLKTLNKEDMAVVQKAHALAQPIKTSELDKEGAMNLLYQPDSARDINNDGFTRIGKGYTWKFPPPNAPAEVHKAWEEATKNLSDEEAALVSGPFMIENVIANVKYSNGKPVGVYGPGDPEYVNPFAQPGYSYADSLAKHIAALKATDTGKMSPAQLEFFNKRSEFLHSLQDSYQRFQVS